MKANKSPLVLVGCKCLCPNRRCDSHQNDVQTKCQLNVNFPEDLIRKWENMGSIHHRKNQQTQIWTHPEWPDTHTPFPKNDCGCGWTTFILVCHLEIWHWNKWLGYRGRKSWWWCVVVWHFVSIGIHRIDDDSCRGNKIPGSPHTICNSNRKKKKKPGHITPRSWKLPCGLTSAHQPT